MRRLWPLALLVLAPAAVAAPALSADPLLPAQPVALRVSGAPPGAAVVLAWGTGTGAGPCPSAWGGACLDVTEGGLAGTATADAAGDAVITLTVPAGAEPGTTVWFQGVVPGSHAALTAPLAATVVHPDDVCDPSADALRTAAAASVECALLAEINAARAVGADCRSQGLRAPTHPLTMQPSLRLAARVQSDWMADQRKLSHRSPGGPLGTTMGERATNAGYTPWDALGETVATGQGTPADVVRAWLASDDHCARLLDPGKRDLGASGARDARGVTWWTADLGRRR